MWSVQRLRVLLFTLIVLAGQAHACLGTWVLPNGTECPSCPKGPCDDGSLLESATGLGTEFGTVTDCHLCCSLSPCEQDDQASATSKSFGFEFQLALTESVLAVPTYGIAAPRSVHVEIEAGFPNAPPSVRQSRAPPSN